MATREENAAILIQKHIRGKLRRRAMREEQDYLFRREQAAIEGEEQEMTITDLESHFEEKWQTIKDEVRR